MPSHNILLLGGQGFIGQNLSAVLKRHHRVTVFDREVGPPPDGLDYVVGDFLNQNDLESVFASQKFDLVVHAVSTTIPSSTDNIFDIESNVVGTIRLLELMKKYRVPKIVFLSSGGTVYGLIEDDRPVTETLPTWPISSHGIGKLTIEKYLHLYHYLHKIDYLTLRLANPYGRYHRSEQQGFINVALKKMLRNEPVEIWGDGLIVRDYVFMNDCAEAIGELIDRGVKNEVLNIGSGQGYSIKEVIAAIEQTIGPLQVTWLGSRKFDVPRIVLDTSKLQSIVRRPFTDLAAGLRQTYDWQKSQL